MADAPSLDHADVERIRALLKDPVAVHLNMLHGHIAKIDMGMLAHAHGQTMQARWAAFERWEAEQATPSPPVAAPPATPADDAVFEFWWADHCPNATQADAWEEWCALRSNQPAQPQPQPAQPLTADQRQDLLAAAFFIACRNEPGATLKDVDAERIADLLTELSGFDLARITAPSTPTTGDDHGQPT